MSPLEMLLRPILERAVRFDSDCASVDELDEQLARTTAEVIGALGTEPESGAAAADAVSFKVHAEHLGGHWHVAVWSSEFGAATTHGRNGVLVFREAEWVAFRQQLVESAGPSSVEIVEEDDRG